MTPPAFHSPSPHIPARLYQTARCQENQRLHTNPSASLPNFAASWEITPSSETPFQVERRRTRFKFRMWMRTCGSVRPFLPAAAPWSARLNSTLLRVTALGTFRQCCPSPDPDSASGPPWPGSKMSIPAEGAQRGATRHPRGAGKSPEGTGNREGTLGGKGDNGRRGAGDE